MCTEGPSSSGVPPVIFAEGVSAGGESSQDTSVFLNCNFRVLSQSVYISNINFRECSFSVYTELSLVPIHPEQRELLLNIGCGNYFYHLHSFEVYNTHRMSYSTETFSN